MLVRIAAWKEEDRVKSRQMDGKNAGANLFECAGMFKETTKYTRMRMTAVITAREMSDRDITDKVIGQEN